MKKYEVCRTIITRQYKVVEAESEDEAITIAYDEDWREKEEVLEDDIEVYKEIKTP